MDIRQTNCPSRHKGALGGFMGSNIQKSWEAVKRLDRLAPTLVHVCGFVCEWTSRLNTSRPSLPQGAFRGLLGGSMIQKSGKLSNGWTDWQQIWYTSADSSGNGHILNTIRPSIPQGAFGGGGLGGHKFKSGKAAKRLDRLTPTLVHVSGFIWEWT